MARGFGRRLRARLFAGIAIGALLCGDATAQITTTYYYDALGRVVAAVNSDGKAIGYTYDAAGNRTQVTNSVPFNEIIPTAFTSSTNTPGDGLTTPMGMRDGAFNTASTVHGTSSAANGYITANFGAPKILDHVDVAPTTLSPWNVGQVAGVQVQWSTDNATWTTVATLPSGTLGQYKSVPMGGVTAQYVRLFQTAAVPISVGDFRFYGRSTVANPPPQANSFSVTFGPAGGVIDLTSHILDSEGLPLTISAFNTPTAAANGAVSQASNTSFSYVPTAGVTGTDTFSYSVTDGVNGTGTGLITVTVSAPVNHPPVANPESIGTIPGYPITFNPLANDSDPDGDRLTVITAIVPAPNVGSAQVNADNTITFTPAIGFSGTSAITYTISDGRGGTASATDPVTVQFGAGPDHPPVTGTVSTSTPAGVPKTFSDPITAATDPDHDTLTIQSVTQGLTGGQVVNNTTSVTYTPPAGAQAGSADQFNYTISDGRGGTATGTAFVSILAAPDRPPVAADDFYSVSGGNSLTMTPLANDSDPDPGDSIIIAGVGAPTFGQVLGHSTTTITYQASTTHFGTDTFTYTIKDTNGLTASATIHVTVNNAPPTAFPINQPVANGQTAVIGAPQNDPEGQAVTFVGFGPSHATSFATSLGSIVVNSGGASATYTSTAGTAGGTDSFSYTITDTQGAQSTSTVNMQVSPPTQLSVQTTASSYDAVLNTLGGSSFPAAVGLIISNGSGSYTYSWTMVAGSGGGIVATSPGGATTQFTASNQSVTNTYTAQFICTVTDTVTGKQGVSNPISVSVDVETGS